MAENIVIQFENASILQDDHLVLSGINFTLTRGEFVYLIGKVGSGKTSLIKTINAELPLKNGEAIINKYLSCFRIRFNNFINCHCQLYQFHAFPS